MARVFWKPFILISITASWYVVVHLRNGSEIPSAVPSPPWGEGRVRGKKDTVVIFEPFLNSQYTETLNVLKHERTTLFVVEKQHILDRAADAEKQVAEDLMGSSCRPRVK